MTLKALSDLGAVGYFIAGILFVLGGALWLLKAGRGVIGELLAKRAAAVAPVVVQPDHVTKTELELHVARLEACMAELAKENRHGTANALDTIQANIMADLRELRQLITTRL